MLYSNIVYIYMRSTTVVTTGATRTATAHEENTFFCGETYHHASQVQSPTGE